MIGTLKMADSKSNRIYEAKYWLFKKVTETNIRLWVLYDEFYLIKVDSKQAKSKHLRGQEIGPSVPRFYQNGGSFHPEEWKYLL
jgi:hypothetical protein